MDEYGEVYSLIEEICGKSGELYPRHICVLAKELSKQKNVKVHEQHVF